jgi:hypothetical protein
VHLQAVLSAPSPFWPAAKKGVANRQVGFARRHLAKDVKVINRFFRISGIGSLTDLEFLVPAISAFGEQNIVSHDLDHGDGVNRTAFFNQLVVDDNEAIGSLRGPDQCLQLDSWIAAIILLRWLG